MSSTDEFNPSRDGPREVPDFSDDLDLDSVSIEIEKEEELLDVMERWPEHFVRGKGNQSTKDGVGPSIFKNHPPRHI